MNIGGTINRIVNIVRRKEGNPTTEANIRANRHGVVKIADWYAVTQDMGGS